MKRMIRSIRTLHYCLICWKTLESKRWEIYLEPEECLAYDGDIYHHSELMEKLAIKLGREEAVTRDQLATLAWLARFHDLGELHFGDKTFNLKSEEDDLKETAYIDKLLEQIQSEYAKEKLNQVVRIALLKKSDDNDGFDFVNYFNAVERAGYLNTALHMHEYAPIINYRLLINNVLYNQLDHLINSSRAFPSIRHYLSKNSGEIEDAIRKQFHENLLASGFKRIYGTDSRYLLSNEYGIDLSKNALDNKRTNWLNYLSQI